MHQEKEIFVYEDFMSERPILMGILYSERDRGKEVFSFEYDKKWLMNIQESLVFDPSLELYEGRQYNNLHQNIFGIFADSCPDRWGRTLMQRRERIWAEREHRKPHRLLESDFLLGVYDEARMGALRFKTALNGEFLANDKEFTTPPWTSLRALEAASVFYEKDESGLNEKWLNQLLAPGSSLGGARPKATVMAPDSSLWIAKFPSKHDEWNSGAWEMVVHELAVLCGLNVPEAKLENFSNLGSTFLVKRFDRRGKRRIHFSSAMTMLGKVDGAIGSEESGYLDLVSFIKSKSVEPKSDLKELWMRIVFFMAVSNTDDHLRNHGFILDENGWRLSPLYDVNPDIYGENLSLNIDGTDDAISFELALHTAKYYEISNMEAEGILNNIKNIVENNWRNVAKKYGLSRTAIEYMSPAFDMTWK